MRELKAVPRWVFITSNMPICTARSPSALRSRGAAGGRSTGWPPMARTRRGSMLRPVAMRAVITVNCSGEAST